MKKRVSAGVKYLAAEGRRFELVFLDPPYQGQESDKTLRLLGESEILEPHALVVAEHNAHTFLADRYNGLVRFTSRSYGETAVSFYEKEGEER
jgi:16S rRNA G966 N2-methylase RsmD